MRQGGARWEASLLGKADKCQLITVACIMEATGKADNAN